MQYCNFKEKFELKLSLNASYKDLAKYQEDVRAETNSSVLHSDVVKFLVRE